MTRLRCRRPTRRDATRARGSLPPYTTPRGVAALAMAHATHASASPAFAPDPPAGDPVDVLAFRALDVSASASSAPTARLTMTTEFALRAGRAGAPPGPPRADEPHDNFLKGVRWSPDGVCLLTCGAEDNTFRVYDIPADLAVVPVPDPSDDDARLGDARLLPDALWPALRVRAPECVYDYAWFPGMTATDPRTCVFASATRAQPVQCWDACDGSLRASYVAHDHFDEPTAATCVAFSADGARVFGGFDGSVRAWHLSRPGRDCDAWVAARRGRKTTPGGGLVGCLAPAPADASLVAAGSYDKTVRVFDATTGEVALAFEGHAGGVTGAAWSPDGGYLYTGARRDAEILCWDVRHAAGPVYRCARATASTNQRIGFDVEPCGRHLVSGGEDGCLRAFDLTTGDEVGAWRAAADVVSDFAFHPCASFGSADAGRVPRGASVSGNRTFRSPADEDEDEDVRGDAVTVDVAPTCALRVWDYATKPLPVASRDDSLP